MLWKKLARVKDCVIVQKVNFLGCTLGEKEVQKCEIFQIELNHGYVMVQNCEIMQNFNF